MRLAALLAIAACAPGCELVFPLDDPPDRFPHVPSDREGEPNDVELVVKGFLSINTSNLSMSGDFGAAEFETMRQDGADSDIVVMRVGRLEVAENGTLYAAGASPLVIIARTIVITEGRISVNAVEQPTTSPGAGGGAPDDDHPGAGRNGGVTQILRSSSGGGGGGFALPGAPGGNIACPNDLMGGGGGDPFGDDSLTLLIGGGAGGRGGVRCLRESPGGAGGGAIQLSATESIEIGMLGGVSAAGAGGGGGAGTDACPSTDGAGSGGGAGGAIYLDAPLIDNRGQIEAPGGGGGGGGGDSLVGGGSGIDGEDGHGGLAFPDPGKGGIGTVPKGTFGGNGGDKAPQAGATGTCSPLMPGIEAFNTGGGGGSPGRIVIRGNLTTFGTILPEPVQEPYPQ